MTTCSIGPFFEYCVMNTVYDSSVFCISQRSDCLDVCVITPFTTCAGTGWRFAASDMLSLDSCSYARLCWGKFSRENYTLRLEHPPDLSASKYSYAGLRLLRALREPPQPIVERESQNKRISDIQPRVCWFGHRVPTGAEPSARLSCGLAQEDVRRVGRRRRGKSTRGRLPALKPERTASSSPLPPPAPRPREDYPRRRPWQAKTSSRTSRASLASSTRRSRPSRRRRRRRSLTRPPPSSSAPSSWARPAQVSLCISCPMCRMLRGTVLARRQGHTGSQDQGGVLCLPSGDRRHAA